MFGRRAKRRFTELPIGSHGPKRRMLLVVNPYASTVSNKLKNVVVYALQSRYEIEAVDTRERGHATEIVRQAISREFDVVCAFGGDGTANEVINGMIGSDVPFTFLPGGLTNVTGRVLGLHNDIVDATEHLLSLADRWEPRRIDLGDANGRVFLFGAGIGLDADIVRVCESRPALKSTFGQNFYLGAALGVFLTKYALRRARFQVKANGFETKAAVVIAQNSKPFTYFRSTPIVLCEGAGLDTGSLGLTALDRSNPLDLLPIVTRLLWQKLAVGGSRHVKNLDAFQTATIRPRRKGLAPLQVDGDYLGEFAEVTITARPDALRVIA